MCGIVGYIGNKEAFPILIKGLKRLEYRGYDSAGIAIINKKNIHLYKKQGKVSELEELIKNQNTFGNVGIGHTRWATHGVPNYNNAHPHLSNSGKLIIIHNGIIENYSTLKKELIQRGYKFKSNTDTEVLINFIDEIMISDDLSLEKSLKIALQEVVGAYAIAIINIKEPNKIYIAKKGSPLAIGIGNNEFFIGSDASPFIEFTKKVVYLENEEIGIIEKEEGLKIKSIINDKTIAPYIQDLKISLENIEKEGFNHFMLKEIHEQPKAIRNTLRGRLLKEQGIISMSSIREYEEKFIHAKRIIILGCGTSWHAGLIAEYIFEELTRIPVEVEYASEFRYRNPIIREKDIIFAISQSGETADTLAAVELSKSKEANIFGICNTVGSSISRISDVGAFTHAGPEIGVASTKAFTAQVTVLTLIAIAIGKRKGIIPKSKFIELCYELDSIPNKIEEMLKTDKKITEIANHFKNARNFLYLGRGLNFPVALEGALKLKEISYIHAEGYPAAEMKHGPIALIDKNMPVVVIATKNENYEKIVSNIQEIKARNGKIIAIINTDDEVIKTIADWTIEIPKTLEYFTPLLTTIPLQLLAYHIAILRNCNVDQPRNLAKSVTVE